MPKRSAGLLAYRRTDEGVEVLLVHPGGPYWRRKDEGAWSLPKGEIDDADEDPFVVAVREFGEELGVDAPDISEAVDIGEVRQPGGKVVRAWAIEGDVDVSDIDSNLFEMEWPPHSGRTQEFPEVDRAEWFAPDDARRKILRGQVPFLDRLQALLDGG
jgi:predicted NUDIX family NTP pyrophosphohydrolase